MASFEMEFPENFLKGLLGTDTDKLCEEMLTAASPELEFSIKKGISQATKDVSTGEAMKSVKARKPKKSKNGAWITFVGPSGYSNHVFHAGVQKARTYKVSNVCKLIWLNYGVPGKQAAKPFLEKSTRDANDLAIAKMQEVYNREVEQ